MEKNPVARKLYERLQHLMEIRHDLYEQYEDGMISEYDLAELSWQYGKEIEALEIQLGIAKIVAHSMIDLEDMRSER